MSMQGRGGWSFPATNKKRIAMFDQHPHRLITTAMKRSLSIPAITRHFPQTVEQNSK